MPGQSARQRDVWQLMHCAGRFLSDETETDVGEFLQAIPGNMRDRIATRKRPPKRARKTGASGEAGLSKLQMRLCGLGQVSSRIARFADAGI